MGRRHDGVVERDRRGRAATWRLAVVVLVLAVTGCGGNGHDYVFGEWHLTAGTGVDGPLELIESHPVTLEVDDTFFRGTAACNTYGGRVDTSGGGWRTSQESVTEMACEPTEVMALERAYLDTLGVVTRNNATYEELVLTGPDGVELHFARSPIE